MSSLCIFAKTYKGLFFKTHRNETLHRAAGIQ